MSADEDAYARKEGFPTKIVMAVLAGIVVVLWLAIGSGFMASSPGDTNEPPTIWLVYEGDIYTGVRGSYCWAGKCVDTSPPEPTGVAGVAKASSIGFISNSLIERSSMDVRLLTVDDLGSTLWVSELESEELDIYRVDVESGEYIVDVFVRWEGLGDVKYAFKISVS